MIKLRLQFTLTLTSLQFASLTVKPSASEPFGPLGKTCNSHFVTVSLSPTTLNTFDLTTSPFSSGLSLKFLIFQTNLLQFVLCPLDNLSPSVWHQKSESFASGNGNLGLLLLIVNLLFSCRSESSLICLVVVH